MSKGSLGQFLRPNFITCLNVKGAEAVVRGGADEDQAPCGDNAAAKTGCAPFDRQGNGRKFVDGAQRDFPFDGALLQIHRHQCGPRGFVAWGKARRHDR